MNLPPLPPNAGQTEGLTSVLDACALIAFLQDESRADVVEDALSDPNRAAAVHAFNLCEVYYHFWRQAESAAPGTGQTAAERAEAQIMLAGVRVRSDLDTAFWKEAARLKAAHRISLADCVCIALAARLNAEIFTSDHHEFDPLAALFPVVFIR